MIIRVAVPVPIHGCFDYLLPHELTTPPNVGARVRVQFGRRTLIGVVVALEHDTHKTLHTLRPIDAILDHEALIPKALLKTLQWVADYYHYPLGEVISTALPKLLRQGDKAQAPGQTGYVLTPLGRETDSQSLRRAPRQKVLLELLKQHTTPLDTQHPALQALEPWRASMRALETRNLVARHTLPCLRSHQPDAGAAMHALNAEQQQAVASITEHLHHHQSYLLYGITGSGKTEVYLQIIQSVITKQRQALVLVPEIALTPQLLARFYARLAVPIALMHSGLTDRERLCTWLSARDGQARVIIGTRSAVFIPLHTPGIIIVDEEHDPSLKQQDSLRYHARDLAVLRAHQAQIPVVLGSATPSLETLANVEKGLYQRLQLTQRATGARLPSIRLIDMRREFVDEGLSVTLLNQIDKHLQNQGQVLLFLNRRGFAPVLFCRECGWSASCPHCDVHLTWHQRAGKLCCHHCGYLLQTPLACPACQGRLDPRGQGTQRIEAALAKHFPGIASIRIDRDTTQGRKAFEQLFKDLQEGTYRILLGTQMLAKGHDLPAISLAAILGADQGLFSTDFRAQERLAQTIIQVAGRAGRGEQPGEVCIQTYQPKHPLFHTLLSQGYSRFGEETLRQRKTAALPPFSHFALLRAEAHEALACEQFLSKVRDCLKPHANQVDILGPVPAPMSRRAGFHRVHLLLQSAKRAALQQLLREYVTTFGKLATAHRVRWSLDVDPIDMS